MTLTAEQALAHGEPVAVVVDGDRYLLMRADVYETARQNLDPSEGYQSVLQSWDAEGSPEDAAAYADLGRLP